MLERFEHGFARFCRMHFRCYGVEQQWNDRVKSLLEWIVLFISATTENA